MRNDEKLTEIAIIDGKSGGVTSPLRNVSESLNEEFIRTS